MDCPEIPRSLYHGSQASECSSSIPPYALCRRIYHFSNTTSQLPQSDRRHGSQSVPSGSPELLSELSSWSAHRLDPQYSQLSAPPSQASSSIPSSIYAPGRTQQAQSLQQYIPSQTSNQYALSSSYFDAITPSVHSHHKYGGGGTTTSFRGSEGSCSGHGWPTYNGDGTLLTSMNASGRRILQGSSRELYSSDTEQSNEQGPNVLSGMGSWGSSLMIGGATVSDGMR